MSAPASLGPLAAVRLVTADLDRLAAFYVAAFGFACAGDGADPFEHGRLRTLTLGRQRLELLAPAAVGRPYPEGAGSADTIFQHVALVAADMREAMARLSAVPGWAPISTNGPEHLPAASGGVAAFKFRDPEGHPLEFLQFPAERAPPAWQGAATGICLGYDHSALTVTDTAESLAFYARLGLARASGSLNQGAEQSRMDGVPDAVVEVTGLGVPGAPPHLELLCYRNGVVRTATRNSDVAATRLVFALPDRATLEALLAAVPAHVAAPGLQVRGAVCAACLRDPDGHRLWLTASTDPDP